MYTVAILIVMAVLLEAVMTVLNSILAHGRIGRHCQETPDHRNQSDIGCFNFDDLASQVLPGEFVFCRGNQKLGRMEEHCCQWRSHLRPDPAQGCSVWRDPKGHARLISVSNK